MIKAAIMVIILNINGQMPSVADVYLGLEDCQAEISKVIAYKHVVTAYCVSQDVPVNWLNVKFGAES